MFGFLLLVFIVPPVVVLLRPFLTKMSKEGLDCVDIDMGHLCCLHVVTLVFLER